MRGWRLALAWLGRPSAWRTAALAALAFAALLVTQAGAFRAAKLDVTLTLTRDAVGVVADGTTLSLALAQPPTELRLTPQGATPREIQVDGSDSLNNFDQDPSWLARVSGTPWYGFLAWMRDMSSYSRWEDAAIIATRGGQAVSRQQTGDNAARITLPEADSTVVRLTLRRPEAATGIEVHCGAATCAEITLDRNNRVFALLPGATPVADSSAGVFFPRQPWPFFAMVVYDLATAGLWCLALLALATALTAALAWLVRLARMWRSVSRRRLRLPALHRLDGWDLIALALTLGSLLWTAYIARNVLLGYPHILDASAYYFQARIFASGHLYAAEPAQITSFQGPFMLAGDGRWFAQYEPMPSALIAVGMPLGVPWLVEPLLGSLALWAIYRIGRRVFGPGTGVLALLLGALSPFYTFLAASYLSHAVALFFAAYALLFTVRAVARPTLRDAALAAACLACLLLTRELTAALLGTGLLVMVALTHGRELLARWRSLWPDAAILAAIASLGLVAYGLYNVVQVGDPFVAPRAVFSPADRYGFGAGIGFYGEHTLAAGMVVLDQLFTALLTTLNGWPFYLTLAFIPLALLRRSVGARWDVFFAGMAGVLFLAQAGYFYHGIYLGPRYLYDLLPYLLLLSGRGIAVLAALLGELARSAARLDVRTAGVVGRAVAGALLAALVAWSLLIYWPRQIELRTGYSGLPNEQKLDLAQVYALHPKHAVVITTDSMIYNYVLFPLNDPALRGETIYAYASDSASYADLRAAYPDRAVYLMLTDLAGHVTLESLR